METQSTTRPTIVVRDIQDLRRQLLALKLGDHQLQQNSGNGPALLFGMSPASFKKGQAGLFANVHGAFRLQCRALDLCEAAINAGICTVQAQTYYTGKNGEQRSGFGLAITPTGTTQAAVRETPSERLAVVLGQAIEKGVDVAAIVVPATFTGDLAVTYMVAQLTRAIAETTPAQTPVGDSAGTPPAADDDIPF